MKNFVLTLLLSAFVFISVHDYIIESIDHDTQSELYLFDLGEIEAVCDITKTHEILHDILLVSEVIHVPLLSSLCIHCASYDIRHLSITFITQGIFYPPIA